MSAGKFSSVKYEADDATVYKCRVQPETLGLSLNSTTNTAPTGAVTGKVSAKITGGNREYGVKCRAVSVRWTGTVPDGYEPTETLRLPILQKAMYDGITPGSTGTYLGSAVEVIGKLPERIR